MMAQVLDLTPGDFVHTLGDAHLYSNHIAQAREQLARDIARSRGCASIRRCARCSISATTTSASRATTRTRRSGRRWRSEDGAALVTLIAAVAKNGVIGRDNALIWRLRSSDLRRFRALTMGKPVVMGARPGTRSAGRFRDAG